MATIGDLPDSLLGAVLAPLGRRRAAAALLVSKRWHRVFLSEPVLWRQFSIDRHAPPQKLASDLALLRRVGGLVASLKVNKHGSEVLAAALSHVQPAALQDLEAYKPEPQQVAALPRFSRLTSLLLSYDFLSGAVAAAFLQLPQLHSLRLLCEHVAGEVPSALAGCTQLSRLAVEAGVFQQPQGLRQLTALRQLKALSLVVLNLDDLGATAVAEDANLYPPDPVLLPALESFNLYFESAPTDVGVQVAGCCLGSCSYWTPDPGEEDIYEDVSGAILSMDAAAAGCTCQLLRALCPGGVPALQSLELLQCSVSAADLESCTELAAVTWLNMCSCRAQGGWEAALAALLRRTPLLSSLSVRECFEGLLPRCLVDRSGLRRLWLSHNGLSVLPGGPYLASLQHLAVADSSIARLPALAAATALTGLEVHGHANGRASLSQDLAAGIPQLPRLQHIQLTGCNLEHLPLEGWAGLSALQSLDLSWNGFTTLPAAVSQAVSLRHLSLSHNEKLPLTARQLGTLLSRLPLLQKLELAGVGLTDLPPRLPSGLRSLDISYNQLRAVPAGLATISLLTCLDLWGNRALCLTQADVDSLLAHSPHLQQLRMQETATPDDVTQYASSRLCERDS